MAALSKVVMTALLASALNVASAADGDLDSTCAAVFVAVDKSAQTPHHAYTTVRLLPGMAASNSETIFTGGVAYEQDDHGRWRRDRMTAEHARQVTIEARAQTEHRCRMVGNETLGGVAATRYETESWDPKIGRTDARSHVWISVDGLVLGERVDPRMPSRILATTTSMCRHRWG